MNDLCHPEEPTFLPLESSHTNTIRKINQKRLRIKNLQATYLKQGEKVNYATLLCQKYAFCQRLG